MMKAIGELVLIEEATYRVPQVLVKSGSQTLHHQPHYTSYSKPLAKGINFLSINETPVCKDFSFVYRSFILLT